MRSARIHAAAGLVLLAALAPSVAGAAEPAPADPELSILKQSLVPGRVGAVDRAAKLATLPRYRFDLELNPEKRRLVGRQQVEYSAEVPLSELYFRIPANASWQSHEENAVRILGVRRDGTEVTFEPRGGVSRLPLNPPLQPGERLSLQIDLLVVLPETSAGTQASPVLALQQALTLFGGGITSNPTDHATFGATDTTISLSGFFPEIAPRKGDQFETHEDAGRGEMRWGPVANYVVSIVTPPGYAVIGTGTEIGSAPERDGRVRTTRVAAAVRGLALVISSELVKKEAKAGPVRVLAWAAKDDELQQRKMLDTAARAVETFAAKYGPYPWATLELTAMPLYGGVECLSFPGLIGCSRLLTDPDELYMMYGTPDAAQQIDRVLEASVAHHVAHQWWGGIVGSDRVNHPELDEPLATQASIDYLARRRGVAASRKVVETYLHGAYGLHRMVGQPDAPVARPISQYAHRGEMEALLRGKGSAFYPALRALVGDGTFAAATKRAVERNAFQDVRADPIVAEAVKLAPAKAKKIRQLYDRYMLQTHGDEDIGLGAGLAGTFSRNQQFDPHSRQALEEMMRMLQGMGVNAADLLRGMGVQGPPPSAADAAEDDPADDAADPAKRP